MCLCQFWFPQGICLSGIAGSYGGFIPHFLRALHLFYRLSNSPFLCMCLMCLSILPLIDICIVSTFWLLWIMSLWKCMYMCPSTFISFGYIPRSGSVGSCDTSMTFWIIARLFSTMAAPLVSLTSNVYILPHPCQSLLFFLFYVILVSVK